MELAIVILADTESHGDLGRLANGLESASDAAAHGAAVEVIFDGAATRWLPLLAKAGHKYHARLEELRPQVIACAYCARAFGVHEEIASLGIKLADDSRGHPSLYQRLSRGVKVLTF